EAYLAALAQQPDHHDARYNLSLLQQGPPDKPPQQRPVPLTGLRHCPDCSGQWHSDLADKQRPLGDNRQHDTKHSLAKWAG
ncbi:hypothetical protein CUC53_18510, partial [Aeromonas cavernicola]